MAQRSRQGRAGQAGALPCVAGLAAVGAPSQAGQCVPQLPAACRPPPPNPPPPHTPQPPCALCQAGSFAEVLCRTSAASAQQVVACQGVPFIRWAPLLGYAVLSVLCCAELCRARLTARSLPLPVCGCTSAPCRPPACAATSVVLARVHSCCAPHGCRPCLRCRDMIDEQQQLLHPQQVELAATAVSCFWLLLRRTRQPGWALRWGGAGRACPCLPHCTPAPLVGQVCLGSCLRALAQQQLRARGFVVTLRPAHCCLPHAA